MRVLFCHGKEGSTDGTKATMLRESFKTAVIPKLTNSYEVGDFATDLYLTCRKQSRRSPSCSRAHRAKESFDCTCLEAIWGKTQPNQERCNPTQ